MTDQNGFKSYTEDGTKCIHEFLEPCYGYANSSGWKGLGTGWWCMDCHLVPRFDEDIENCSPEEIEHNRRKREALLTCKEVC